VNKKYGVRVPNLTQTEKGSRMLFLVELDHVKFGTLSTPETGRAFIENIIFPTLARAEQLVE
jgi:hypothetical protein